MSPLRGNLKPAHKGYLYQDITTAYMLVRAVVERYDAVIVDRKQVEDDRIDDLEVAAAGRRVRRQFKSSENTLRTLASNDFTSTASSLRIDRLVLTHIRSEPPYVHQYRLCATWKPPLAEDQLTEYLEPASAEPTIENWPSQCYRLRSDRIWPANGNPVWGPLLAATRTGAEIGRDAFLTFCDRFIIELSLPMASTSLTEPGPLERALIDELSERVGIGRYPNQGREPACPSDQFMITRI